MKKEVAYAVLIICLFFGVLAYTNNRERINFFGGDEDSSKYDAPNFLFFIGVILLVVSVILIVISLFSRGS